MVRVLALRSGDPGFKTRSDHSLNLFLVVPGSTALVNSQLVCLRPVGILSSCVVVFCCFVDCFRLALKSPYGEWSIKHVLYCIVINHEVYLGKQRGRVLVNGLGYSVVMELMNPFLNKNHHVYFDNFFSSPKLLEDLQNEGTYACSTVRAGRVGLLPSSR